MLHLKPQKGSIKATKNIKAKELEDIYNRVWCVSKNKTFDHIKINIIELIFNEAESINGDVTSINLENKILLSIAIRLKAEILMISKINDSTILEKIYAKGSQTAKLIDNYKDIFKENSGEKSCIELLDEVSLMTSENIHLNSFMYEPILDLGENHLVDLYKNLKHEIEVFKEQGGILVYE